MIKKLLPSYAALVFLVLLVVTGLAQGISDYRRYGWQYEITTIINGVAKTSTVDIRLQFVSIFIFIYLSLLLSFNLVEMRKHYINNNPNQRA